MCQTHWLAIGTWSGLNYPKMLFACNVKVDLSRNKKKIKNKKA
jgi:hypothetical protein